MSLVHGRHGPEARRAFGAGGGDANDRPSSASRNAPWRLGLQGADSIVDRTIPTFSRGELPHFAGINTFLKAPYVEDVHNCGDYDVAVLGAPFDCGTTYRPGTRFRPQGMRRISALYGTYSFELGVDLRESITIGDLGDIFTIPGNLEKSFDQITKAVSHVFASGALPVVLGGDHSIGYPTVRGVAEHLERQPRDHPLRPPCRHPGDRPRRAHAHHALVPCHRLAQRARRATWSSSGSEAGRPPAPGQGMPGAGNDDHDGQRLRRHGPRRGGRDGAGSGLGRGRSGVAVIRCRLPGRRLRARHRVARARRFPTSGGAQARPAVSARGPGRHRGSRMLAALRQRRYHLVGRGKGHLRRAGHAGQ